MPDANIIALPGSLDPLTQLRQSAPKKGSAHTILKPL
jgi:hypothetical protein